MLFSRKMSTFALMIEIDRHIEILLLSNDCVIVPGLGGFMAHHVEARYDEEEQRYLPPLRTLGFNPLLKLNDSLLAQSYIEAYDISYPEATRRIEEEVDELKQHLCNEGEYELKGIGTLRINDEGNYIFEPCEAGILTPDLYGLHPFEIKRLAADTEGGQAEGTHTRAADSADTRRTAAKAAPAATGERQAGGGESTGTTRKSGTGTTFAETQHTADADTEAKEDGEERTIKIKVAWLRNIAAVAAAVAAFFVFTPPVANSDRDSMAAAGPQEQVIMSLINESMAPRPAVDLEPTKIKAAVTGVAAKTPQAAAPAAKADTTPAGAVADTATENTTATAAATEAAAPSEKDSMRYCIVMASHITRRNAEAYVKELHDNGLAEAHTYEHNKIMRVVYGRYASEKDAQAALRDIRGNKYFEQSWVYKKR